MKVRIRYENSNGDTAEQVFPKTLEITATKDGKKLIVTDKDGLHVDWIEPNHDAVVGVDRPQNAYRPKQI